jgi:hypothetical protein
MNESFCFSLSILSLYTRYLCYPHQRVLWNRGTVEIFWNEVVNQNMMREEIKRRMDSGNACYHSIKNILSSHLLSKNVKIRITRL